MLSAEPVCSCAFLFLPFAHETAGAARTRLSLHPLVSEGEADASLGRIAPRECEVVSGIGESSLLRGANGSRECAPADRLRDEAIQLSFFLVSRSWIASLALAMTVSIPSSRRCLTKFESQVGREFRASRRENADAYLLAV
jgi:hypothetical protein